MHGPWNRSLQSDDCAKQRKDAAHLEDQAGKSSIEVEEGLEDAQRDGNEDGDIRGKR